MLHIKTCTYVIQGSVRCSKLAMTLPHVIDPIAVISIAIAVTARLLR